MSNGIQLISDRDGMAVIGNPTDVERFLHDQGLDRTPSKGLDMRRVAPLLGSGGAVVQVGSERAAQSGRWMKLTKDSAETVRRCGLVPIKIPGVSHAIGPE